MANLVKKESVTSYTLELTEKEANYLELVLRNTNTNTNTAVPESDTVWKALDSAGIDGDDFFNIDGHITISEY